MALTIPPARLSQRAARLVSGDGSGSLARFVSGASQSGSASHLMPRALTREGVLLEHHLREGRFQRSLALIAGLSGLLGGLEVSYEHYRGSYGQRIMYSPVFISAGLAAVGIASVFSRRAARVLLPLASASLLFDGVVGFFFHIRGVQRKPGGWRIPVFNVVMGPPLFAPLLLGVGGFLGMVATFLRREDDPASAGPALPGVRSLQPRTHLPFWTRFIPRSIGREGLVFEQDLREGRFQQLLAGAAAVSALLNGLEALYSHYKSNFRYRVQWLPIVVAPFAIVAGIGAIFSKTIAHTVLPVVSLVALLTGGIGFFFHLRGVVRRPGGLRHALYNVLYGPPIFAPLLYAATGFLGLLASLLRRA